MSIRPTPEQFLSAALAAHQDNEHLRVQEPGVVIDLDDIVALDTNGAWVMAWVWVPDEDAASGEGVVADEEH